MLENYNRKTLEFQKEFEKVFVNRNFDSKLQMYSPKCLIWYKKIWAFEKYENLIKDFEDENLKKILAYPLGCLWLDLKKWYETWVSRAWNKQQFYIKWWIYNLILALEKLARKYWVEIKTNQKIENFLLKDWKAIWVQSEQNFYAKNIISSIDRRVSEKMLWKYAQYDEDYFSKKHFSPSWYVIHLGIDKRLWNLSHHNYIFSPNFYDEMKNLKNWKSLFHEPSVYICCPTQSDKSLAPSWCEILSILVHTPIWLEPTQEQIHDYAAHIMWVVENCIDEEITRYVVQKHIISIKNYQQDSNPSWSIYGLTSSLDQIGGFRPINYSKKIKNIYYVGHTTALAGMSYGIIWAQLACEIIK